MHACSSSSTMMSGNGANGANPSPRGDSRPSSDDGNDDDMQAIQWERRRGGGVGGRWKPGNARKNRLFLAM